MSSSPCQTARVPELCPLAGAQELIHILSGVHGIVPTTEDLVWNEVELPHFCIGDLDPGVIVLRDEVGVDAEAGFRFGGTDEMEDLLDIGEGFSGPVFADLAEQAVLDGIPFGSTRWIVAHGNDETERRADRVLNGFPPDAGARSVTSSAISQNE